MGNVFKRALAVGVAATALIAGSAMAAQDKGTMAVIVNDPANPYWYAEGQIAKKEAQQLGYKVDLTSHKGDTNAESQQIDTAITNKVKAIILDPANVNGSIGAVRKAVAANIPVFIVNAEINQQGLAKAQLVSNNAQGAALGAQYWVEKMGEKGRYIELKGPPSDNNAATRSNGYQTVLSQYPDMKLVASDIASWDRTQGYNKTQSMLQAHPDIQGVLSGNDDMAMGAIAALKQAGKLKNIVVGSFDGSPDAVKAIKNGELPYTVLQPVARFTKDAVTMADKYVTTGETGVEGEKHLYDCSLITPDNVKNYVGPFEMKE